MFLRPASSIHMAFTMRFPIDAVFLARDLTVLKVVNDLAPWRMASKLRAHSSPRGSGPGACERNEIREGDRLTFA